MSLVQTQSVEADYQTRSAEFRTSQYTSKLVAWEVWNFMSIKHGKVEFDERNIINIKGYNDSGKSAMLRALDVLFFNIKPTAQTGFIQDGEEYFRVIAYFDDGVFILRDKYINGQGLYEIYKDNKCIFTTKLNGVLSKIREVPEPVQEYLGLIKCDKWNVNSRSCFEKQLLVETTGSENYSALNEALRSEEITVASEMLNADKNKLNADIRSADQELDIYKRQIKSSRGVSSEFIQALREHDENLDISEERLTGLGLCANSMKNLQEIPDIPEVPILDTSRISELGVLSSKVFELSSIPNIPETKKIDNKQLVALISIQSSLDELKSIPDIPECSTIGLERLEFLSKIESYIESYKKSEEDIQTCDSQLRGISDTLEACRSKLEELGEKYVVCQNCGAMVAIDSGHIH